MRKPLPLMTLLLTSAALAGCNLAPKYVQPTPPVPQAFDGETAGLRSVDEIGWRTFFGDPLLQTYIAAALERNRDLAQSVARVEQARAQYRITDSQRLPSLQVGANASTTSAPTDAQGFAQPGMPARISYEQYSVQASVPSFELDFWGRVRNLSDAARAQYLASVEGERAFRLSLISQVAATYLAIRAGDEQITLAEKALNSRREGLRIAQLRLDAGVTSTVDYDQAALLVSQAESEIAESRRVLAQNRNLLMVLTGGPVEGPLPEGRALVDSGQMQDIQPGLPSDLLTRRPDILAAEQQLRAANANIGAARAAFLPSISLTAAAGLISPALGSLIEGDSRNHNVAAAAVLPIFDWGRRNAQLRLSKAQADEMVAAYQRTTQTAFQEVANALASRQRYAEQVSAQQRAVEAQRRLARVARLRYDNGIAIYLEVLDAERSLFAAEQQLVALRSAELQSGVSLYTALGGGTHE